MKKTKIFLGSIAVFAMCCVMKNVSAEEFYYVNDNGVALTEKEYQYISDLYWDGYQQYLTESDYQLMREMNIFDNEIKKSEVTNYPVTRGNMVTSHLRTSSLKGSCSDTCLVTFVTAWNGIPTIKSYDVVGIRLGSANLSRIVNIMETGSNYSKIYNDIRYFTNGFGASILVPNTENVKTTITIITTKGTLYGTYQHAKRNITEDTSKNYTIGQGGYGDVFYFSGPAVGVYDEAPGVDLVL